jgi:transcriptional regulator with XRE-family HTH domain
MISPEQIRAARAMLKWPAKELAEKAVLSVPTVQRIESGADAMGTTIQAIEKALEAAGIEFLPDNGVRLRSK